MFNKILQKIKNKEPFALIRFGDGEYTVLQNVECHRNGFYFNPKHTIDAKFKKELMKSLIYDGGENYIVGVCNKNVGKNSLPNKWLKSKVCRVTIDADIFVNKNYLRFIKEMVPLFRAPILVANKLAMIRKLPFDPLWFRIDDSAWKANSKLHEYLLDYLQYHKEPQIVLVAGGAFSNVLIHKLWEKNKNHIYLDIGSTLDPYIFGKNTRGYQRRLDNERD